MEPADPTNSIEARLKNAREIGLLVRNERRRQDLDQRTLALVSDVGVSAIHRVEHGQGVRVDTLIKILAALGLELAATRRAPPRS